MLPDEALSALNLVIMSSVIKIDATLFSDTVIFSLIYPSSLISFKGLI